MYTNNALFFPHHLIPTLRKLRGGEWQSLVERVMTLPELHEETLALMLLVARLDGCVSCETDSYRAMRGCAACAAQTLRRHKGSDSDLLEAYESALTDIRAFTAAHCAMQPPSLFGDVIAQASRSQP
jgi:hypothetical protein